MKHNLLRALSTAVFATGMIWAQDAPGLSQGADQGQTQNRHAGRGNPMARLGAQLNLTDAQKAQAAGIFQSARQQSQPLAQELHQYRLDLAAAVKSGGPAEQIDAVTAKMGPLMSQLAGIQAKAFQKFYAGLTPEQQQKVGEHLDRFLGGGMMGFHPASARHAGTRAWHSSQQ